MAKKRHRARELTLQALYMAEIGLENMNTVLERIREHEHPDAETYSYVERLVSQVLKKKDALDTVIQQQCRNWDLRRVAVLDKNILRMAITEILHFKDIPEKVSIDEAIELAKSYSTEKSGTFVNGILDPIAFVKEKDGK